MHRNPSYSYVIIDFHIVIVILAWSYVISNGPYLSYSLYEKNLVWFNYCVPISLVLVINIMANCVEALLFTLGQYGVIYVYAIFHLS